MGILAPYSIIFDAGGGSLVWPFTFYSNPAQYTVRGQILIVFLSLLYTWPYRDLTKQKIGSTICQPGPKVWITFNHRILPVTMY